MLGAMDTSPPPAAPSVDGPPPPPFGSPRPRELRRRPDHGPLAGVCAGVAEYFHVDPVLVRIATVVLAVSGPGVVAYLLAWIFIPAASASSPATAPADRRDRGTQVFGIVLLTLSVSILWEGWWSPARRWIFPLGLMALGTWLLLRRDRDEPPTAAPPGGSAPAEGGLSTDTTSVAVVPFGEASGPDDQHYGSEGIDQPPPATPADPRRRMLAPIVMGALLLWVGVGFLGGVSLQNGLAIALCILGIGFVLGAFVGGSRALIIPAVLVAAALVASAVIDIPLKGPVGDRAWMPLTLSQVDDRYELSAGEGRLDLTELAFADDDHLEIAASIGVGHLVVEVPAGVAVHVSAHVSAGETVLFGASQSGVGLSVERSYGGGGYTGAIALDLEVGLGEIEVIAQDAAGRPQTPGTTTTLLG